MLISLLACAWLTPADLAARLGGDSTAPDDTGLPDTDAPDTDCVTSTWYADGDSDHYGDDGDTLDACEQPSGYSSVGGDCDDDDAAVHPEQIETCGNGTDEDCDGSDASCVDGDVEVASVGALSMGAGSGDETGTRLLVGDYDQDGTDDWVTTAPFSAAGAADGGAIYVMDGDSGFGTPLAGTAMAAFVGGAAGDFTGVGVGFAGSFLGDQGCNNLVFAGPGYDHGGYGDVGFVGLVACDRLGNYDFGVNTEVIEVGFYQTLPGAGLGAAVAGSIAFSDHAAGLDDLALGAPGYNGGDGAVWLVYGEEVDDTDKAYALDVTRQSMRYDAESAADYVGFSVAGLGDHTGDGFHDFATGAIGVAAAASGKVHIVAGGGQATGFASLGDATLTLYGESSGDEFGYAIAALGDVDGDGLADLAVTARQLDHGSGRAYVVLGTARDRTFVGYADIADYAHTRVLGDAGTATFGSSVAAVDVDDDGNPELVVGATQEQTLSNGGGAVYVMSGLGAGTYSTTEAAAVLYRADPDGVFGRSVAPLSNGGHSWLLVGNSSEDGEASDAGGVWSVPLF